MRKYLLFLSVIIGVSSYGQTVSGWDAVVTGQYGSRNYHLIGTYQGWDTAGIYIAGYNHYNNSTITTQRVYMGNLCANLQNGWIGIGQATPQAPLDIAANAIMGSIAAKTNTPLTLIKNGDGNGTDNPSLLIKYTGTSAFTNPATDLGIIRIQGFNTSAVNKSINSNDNFYVFTNGFVQAKEVKVTTIANDWPDYVFTTEHRLPSLEFLAKQIKAEGHLPNIPSAEEVSKNGIALGEMNKKLLEKVEELTLYMIEMKKENNELKQRIEKLESKN